MISEKNNIIFRIDSSSQIGLGHLMRTLLLANGLKEHFNIVYFTQNLKGNQNHLIDINGFVHVELESSTCREFILKAKEYNPTLCIIDNYEIDIECEKELSQNLCDIYVFDDEFKDHHAKCVINHSFTASKKDYDYLKNTKILAGSSYTLLKNNFLSQHSYTPLKSLKNKKVLITLGGSDPLNLSLKVKKYLLKIEKTLHVTIVTTSANLKASYIKRVDKESIINCSNMSKLMSENDLIITSASTSMLETFALKKPFIAIQCATNQAKAVDVLLNQNISNVINNFNYYALKRALNFVTIKALHVGHVLNKYKFSSNGISKDIIKMYEKATKRDRC